MLLRYLLPTWLLLSSLTVACQPATQPATQPAAQPTVLPQAKPLGPVATGQPGHWDGPPAPTAAPEQRVTARLIPFRQQGRYGLLTPQGRVVLPATLASLPRRVYRDRHLWYASLPAGSTAPLVLLGDSGQVLGQYHRLDPVPGSWGWTQALGPRRTITLYDSLGRLIRATPYGKLEAPTAGRMVVALPDSLLPDGSGGLIGGLRGVIDSLGREVAPPRYTTLKDYRQGYAYATLETPWPASKLLRRGVLDRQGRPHWLPPQWQNDYSLHYQGGFFAGWSNEQRAATAVALDGRVLIPYSAKFLKIERPEHIGTDVVVVETSDPSGPTSRRMGTGYYAFDSLLRPLLPPHYQRLEPRTNGWTIVHAYPPDAPGRPAGYDEQGLRGATWHGRLVLPADYGPLDVTSDGRFVVAGQAGRYVTSELGAPPQPLASAEQVRYVGHGVFAVRQAGHWGLVRAGGQVLLPSQEEIYLDHFEQGRYFYHQGAWLDTLGRPVLPAGQFAEVRFMTPTLAWVSQQGRYGVYSRRAGRLVVPLTLTRQPGYQDSVYWGSDGQRTLVGRGDARPLAVPNPIFWPVAVAWPQLVLGHPAGDTQRWELYNAQKQLLSTEVVSLAGGLQGGTVWAGNAQGRFALLDSRGRLLTPFAYRQPSTFAQGIWLTSTADDNQEVAVDCLGRAYAW